MISRVNSAPKMRVIQTPRTKDGRRSNDQVHSSNYYNTNQFQAAKEKKLNDFYNPEKQDYQTAKKIDHKKAENLIEMKISKGAQKSKQQQRVEQKRQKLMRQSFCGRKLEYPAHQYRNIQKEYNSSKQMSRVSSASLPSRHYVDRSQKSSKIKIEKAEFDEKFKKAFDYLLDGNQKYLKERRRACIQKARPKEQMFKVLRPKISTTYKDEYPQKVALYEQGMEAQNLKTANSFANGKVCGNSTTNEFHNGKKGPRADLQSWPDGWKLQGPLDGTTTYGNKFPHHGDYERMVPIATFNEHPLGFKHKANSTSRSHLKGDKGQAAKLADWNNPHPYGNKFNPNKGTTYGNLHNNKQQQPVQQWPMNDPRLIVSDGKFDTQYRTNLINHNEHQLNAANYCDCGRKHNQH